MLSNIWIIKNLKFLNCTVKQFQTLVHITADAVYGPVTDLALINYIKIIQEKLGANQDGLAGDQTKQKCIEFQKRNGLVPDGICGIKTREKLFQTTSSWNFPHFKKEEFNCKCGCGANNINHKLVQVLEDIRFHFGGNPVIITSGTRCQKHNAAVGGIRGSKHLEGKAADFYIKNITTRNLLSYCQTLVKSGILNYTYTNSKNMKGVVHIDIK